MPKVLPSNSVKLNQSCAGCFWEQNYFKVTLPRRVESRVIQSGGKIQLAMGTRSMADGGVSAGDHGPGKAVILWHHHAKESPLGLWHRYSKNPKNPGFTADLERNAQPLCLQIKASD